ncbi:hypothetical protein KEM56_000946, partial [Ascosphaera pollenicola]
MHLFARIKSAASRKGHNRDSVADKASNSPSSPRPASSQSDTSSRTNTIDNVPANGPPPYGRANNDPRNPPKNNQYPTHFGPPSPMGQMYAGPINHMAQAPQYPYLTHRPSMALGIPPHMGPPRNEAELPGKPRTQLVVGIDFGTTFSGVAFAFVNDHKVDDHLIEEWPGCGTERKQKISTIIRYDQHTGQIVSWGELTDGLSPTNAPKKGVMQLRFFKLYLDPEGSYGNGSLNMQALPPGKGPINVISDYLHELHTAAVASMRKTLGEIYDREQDNIKYFLTVPAIWDDAAKANMRMAAAEAGLVENKDDRRLSLISEPEAAALFCVKNRLLSLKKHDAILVVDCGGGTVDLIAYQVEEEDPLHVSECTPGSGALVGSAWLNQKFMACVREKLKKAGLDKQDQAKAAKIAAKCVSYFDSTIKGNFLDSGRSFACDVGVETDYPAADIEEGYMNFSNDEILACFEPIVQQILDLVKNQIEMVQAQQKSLTNILLIGGFGASEYLYQKIQDAVPPKYSKKVVRPMEAVSAIVRGAVTAGVTERLITSRVARKHYLLATLEPFVEGTHKEEFRIPSVDGRDRCRNCRQIYVQKGDRLYAGKRKVIPFFRLVQSGANLVYEDILYVCELDEVPQYISDPGIKEYVTLTSDLSKMDLERDFERVETESGIYYKVKFEVAVILDAMDAPWRDVVSKKRESLNASIPEEWRVSTDLIPVAMRSAHESVTATTFDKVNVMNVPRACGLLSEKELRITEDWDVNGLLEELRAGRLSAVEVCQAFCKRAAIAHQVTRCLTEPLFQDALERASKLDSQFARLRGPVGPLHGLPISVKDCFDIEGVDSTIGMAYHAFKPAKRTAPLVEMLRSLGAVIIAKTNVPQSIGAFDSVNYVFGRTMNPLNYKLSAGGSSGGEAALIAMRGSMIGIGTDFGGSNRVPPMCCGIYGLKPSTGRFPYGGQSSTELPGKDRMVVKAAAGPIARSVNDIRTIMKAVVPCSERFGADCIPGKWESETPASQGIETGKFTIGVLRHDGLVEPLPPVANVLNEVAEKLKKTPGIEVVEIS